MSDTDAGPLLEGERYLFLRDLRMDTHEGHLLIAVDAAAPSPDPTCDDNPDIDQPGPIHMIETSPGCLAYQLLFTHVVGHLLRDESFAQPEPSGMGTGPLKRFHSSTFLDYIHSVTVAQQLLDQLIWHYQLVTLDAIIDIATTTRPQITARMIAPDDPGSPTRPAPTRPARR